MHLHRNGGGHHAGVRPRAGAQAEGGAVEREGGVHDQVFAVGMGAHLHAQRLAVALHAEGAANPVASRSIGGELARDETGLRIGFGRQPVGPGEQGVGLGAARVHAGRLHRNLDVRLGKVARHEVDLRGHVFEVAFHRHAHLGGAEAHARRRQSVGVGRSGNGLRPGCSADRQQGGAAQRFDRERRHG